MRKYLLFIVVLALGVGLNALVAYWVHRQEHAMQYEAFLNSAREQRNVLETALYDSMVHTHIIAAIVSSVTTLDLQKFQSIARPVINHQAYLLATAWLPQVRQTQRVAYEQQAQTLYSHYQIWEHDAQNQEIPAQNRATYFPFYHLVQNAQIAWLLGLDLAATPVYRQAIDMATKHAQTQILLTSGTLINSDETLVVVIVPVYFTGQANTVATPAQLRGVVVSLYSLNTLWKHALQHFSHRQTMVMTLYDAQQQVLYQDNAAVSMNSDTPAQWHTSQQLTIANQHFQLALSSQPSKHYSHIVWLVFVAGSGLTSVLLLLLYHVWRFIQQLQQRLAFQITTTQNLEQTNQDLAQHNMHLKIEVDQHVIQLAQSRNHLDAEITYCRQQQQLLHMTQQRFNGILDNLTAFVYLQDGDYHIRYANRYFVERFGQPDAETLCYRLLRKRVTPCQDCTLGFSPAELHQEHRTVVSYQATLSDDRIYAIHSYPFEDYDGSRLVLKLGFDITARQQAEEQLRQSEEFLRLILNSIPQSIFWKDTQSVYQGCNSRFAELVKLSHPDEVEGRIDEHFIEAVDAEHLRAIDQHAIISDNNQQVVQQIQLRQETEPRWLELCAMPLHNRQGDVEGVLVSAEDVTLRRSSEAVLRNYNQRLSEEVKSRTRELVEQTQRFNAVLNGLELMVYVSDFHTDQILFSNNYANQLFARPLIGQVCWQVLQFKQTGRCELCTNSRLLDSNGKPSGVKRWEYFNQLVQRWFYVQDQAIYWDDGRLVRLSMSTDITKRKQFEEQLRDSEKHLREVQRIAKLGYWEWFIDAKQVKWSEEVFECYGIPPTPNGTVTLQSLFDHVHPDDAERVQQNINEALAQCGNYILNMRIVRDDGEIRYVEGRVEVVCDEEGMPLRMLGTSQDVTERKLAEIALQQREHFLNGLVEIQKQLLFTRTKASQLHAYDAICTALGKIFSADEVMFFESHIGSKTDKPLKILLRGQWQTTQLNQVTSLQAKDIDFTDFSPYWLDALQRSDGPVLAHTCDLPLPERDYLTDLGIKAFILFPLHAHKQLHGFVVFNYYHDRADWADSLEIDAMWATMASIASFVERQKAEQALSESEQRFRSMADSAPVLIWLADTQQHRTYCNTVWLQFTGRSLLQELGSGWLEGVHPDNLADYLMITRQAFATHQPFKLEYRLCSYNGQYRWIQDIGVPRFSAEGYFEGYIGSCLDITERHQAQEALQEAKEEAERANRAKTTFLANMSHELRTPLNSILGYAQILERDTKLNEAEHNAARIIQRSGEHLLILINDILDLSKIEAEQLELTRADFRLPEFLRDIVELFKMRATQKGIEFIYNSEASSLPTIVYGDEKRLRQILLNLLSNAIKFTNNGHVSLQVQLHDKAEWIHFQVEDTGMGIAPNELEEIFKPFRQVGNKQYHHDGTGLGLSITQNLVQLMGGELCVSSVVNQGSVFDFAIHLPATQAEKRNFIFTTSQTTSQPTPSGYQGSVQRVLVADDVLENRSVLCNLLQPLGFEVCSAVDGEHTLEQALAFQPDIILLDMRMPKLNGIEVTQRLRRNPLFDNVVIIALSASVYEQQQQSMLQAGCNAFLAKPVNFSNLFNALTEHASIEWYYAETVKDYANTPQSIQAEQTVLPSDVLAELLALVESGKIKLMLEKVDELKVSYPNSALFLQNVTQFIKQFQLKQLKTLLRKTLEQ